MNLTTRYLGLELKNPFVPSASPLSRSLESARRLEDAGASGLIMYSLFEEVATAEDETIARLTERSDRRFFDPTPASESQDFPGELDRYLEQIATLKASLEIPVIASLNGTTVGGWVEHARDIEDAGADALELNIYHVAADVDENSADVERRHLDLLHEVKKQTSLPINIKLSPFFSSIAHMVKKLDEADAAGVAMFNRFYQPDINLENLRLAPVIYPSTSQEALLAMRWIAILYGRTELSLGATGGVHTADDSIKLLLAGADVVHLCTALLQQGPEQLTVVIDGLVAWMESNDYEDIDLVRGRVSQMAVADPSEFERASYLNVIDSHSHQPGIWG